MENRGTSIATAPSWGRRLGGMDGLRGIAAVTVLMGHVQSHLGNDVPGAARIVGVLGNGLILFFALSGFLLFRPFASSIVSGERLPATKKFLMNRALRILPGYWFVLILVAFVFGLAFNQAFPPGTTAQSSQNFVGRLTNPLIILTNVPLLQTFFPFSMKTGLGVAWTLSVEMIFYLVIPLVGYLGWKARRFTKNALWAALLPVVIVFAVGFIGKLIVHFTFHPVPAESFYLRYGDNWTAVFMRSFLVYGDLFSFGMLAAVVFVAFETNMLSRRWVVGVRWGALAIGLIVAIADYFVGFGAWSESGFALCFGALVLFVALPLRDGERNLAARALDFGPVKYVGLISYGVYLWHDPILIGMARAHLYVTIPTWGYWINVCILFTISSALASATYFFIEKPALRLKRRTDSESRIAQRERQLQPHG